MTAAPFNDRELIQALDVVSEALADLATNPPAEAVLMECLIALCAEVRFRARTDFPAAGNA